MNMESKIDRLTKLLKNIGFLLAIVTAMGTTIYVSVNKAVDNKFNVAVQPLADRVERLELYTEDQIIKNIIKQAEKIKKEDYQDIKDVDLLEVLKNFSLIINPSEKIKIDYETVKKYYLAQNGQVGL